MDYTKTAKSLWDNLVSDGQKLFKTQFKRDSEKEIDTFSLNIDGFKFICKEILVTSLNQGPILYYQCQLLRIPESDDKKYKFISFDHTLNPNDDSFFIFIPTDKVSNPNLRNGKPTEGTIGEINTDSGRIELKKFISDCCLATYDASLTTEEHDSLNEIEALFLQRCDVFGIESDLQVDTNVEKAYLVPIDQKDKFFKLEDDIPDDIIMTFNGSDDIHGNLPKRRDGVLISFKKSVLNDYWQHVTDKDKKKRSPRMSILLDKDAEKVDRGETLAQAGKPFDEELLITLDSKYKSHVNKYVEDQYKNPTGRQRRKQSSFPSSFSRSMSFGGIKEMVAPHLEPDTNIGVPGTGANTVSDFSNATKKKTQPKPYNKRKDITDLEMIGKYKKVTDFAEDIFDILERTIPRHKLSHPDDPGLTHRSIEKSVVPDPTHEPEQSIDVTDVTNSFDSPLHTNDNDEIIKNNVSFQFGAACIRPQKLTNGSGPISNVSISKGSNGVGSFAPDKITVLKSPVFRLKNTKRNV